jgi:chorismate mutase
VEPKEHPVTDMLQRYRESIDNIDAALVFMLAERFKVTQAVGEYKATHALPPDFTEKFLRFIIDEVIRHHEQLRDG